MMEYWADDGIRIDDDEDFDWDEINWEDVFDPEPDNLVEIICWFFSKVATNDIEYEARDFQMEGQKYTFDHLALNDMVKEDTMSDASPLNPDDQQTIFDWLMLGVSAAEKYLDG